ncbi:flavodoxin domain-containing protein [Blastococcus atacamensis]|uniref:flavodoxin domain-containing protein n=1 Tax=Blastococcus atacamensis TaxID=2070508 RepID=UPI0012FFF24F|nr:flavodoxin domain-containing protein [Blastococcus atacamensis]
MAVASRHGSTREIASALARGLTGEPVGPGEEVVSSVIPVESRPEPAGYHAVVLGSAVYGGCWLPAAREFAAAHAATLRSRPLWLFSSGPIGSPPFPDAEPYDAATLRDLLGPRGHRVLPGRLEPRLLTFAERAMATAMRAPVGDFRDWALVPCWQNSRHHNRRTWQGPRHAVPEPSTPTGPAARAARPSSLSFPHPRRHSWKARDDNRVRAAQP